MMKVIAVTGRSGSGKSTVSAYYAKLGYPVLDADRTAREIVQPGSPCLEELCRAFGEDLIRPDGTLDRALLAARAFQTKETARRLTDITHPAIVKRLLDGVEQAQQTGRPFVFVDGAVIVGEAFEPYCDSILVVTAPERLSISRIMLRDGISKTAAQERLSVQMPEAVLCAAADHIIENTGSNEALCANAQAVLDILLQKETHESEEKEEKEE